MIGFIIGINGNTERDRGNVFGAGSGVGTNSDNQCNTSSGSVTTTTNVEINGGIIYRNVYGGGALAMVGPPFAGNMLTVAPNVTIPYDEFKETTGTHKSNSYTSVNIKGGSISGSVYGASRGPSDALLSRVFTVNNVNVYDETRFATVIYADVNVSGNANIAGSVYGGGEKGIVKHATLVNIGTTNAAYTGTISHDVFGGGQEATVGGNVEVNVNSGTILQDVYGGGALANTNVNTHETHHDNTYDRDVNDNGAQTSQAENAGLTTTVNLKGGKIRDVFGGALGRLASGTGNDAVAAVEAKVYGNVTVNLNEGVPQTDSKVGAAVNRIFGANNLNGTPKGHVKVHVFATQNPYKPTIASSDKYVHRLQTENESFRDYLRFLIINSRKADNEYETGIDPDVMAAAGKNLSTNMSSGDMTELVKMQITDLAEWDIQSQKITGEYGEDYVASLSQKNKYSVYYTDAASVKKCVDAIQALQNPSVREKEEALKSTSKSFVINYLNMVANKIKEGKEDTDN